MKKNSDGGTIPSDYFKPSGTLSITENGLYDVKSYASASVNVAGGGGISVDDWATDSLTGSIYLTASNIRSYAFVHQDISSVNAPGVLDCGNCAFQSCFNLTTASFPAAITIGNSAFQYCSRLTTASFPVATFIGYSAFYGCFRLETANFPAATTIGGSAFQSCLSLTTVSFPAATSIGSYALANCSSLATVDFPVATSIGNYAFQGCSNLTTASFSAATYFGNQVFRGCRMLTELRLDSVKSVPSLGTSVFFSTPIGGYSVSAGQYGSVFVPASLYQSFLTATNWSSISSRIVSV